MKNRLEYSLPNGEKFSSANQLKSISDQGVNCSYKLSWNIPFRNIMLYDLAKIISFSWDDLFLMGEKKKGNTFYLPLQAAQGLRRCQNFPAFSVSSCKSL